MPVAKRRKPAYRHILVPTDGTPRSARAEKAANALAGDCNARVTTVHVVAPYSTRAVAEVGGPRHPALSADEYKRLVQARARAVLRKVTARARRARVPVESVVLVNEAPAEAIVDVARERGCDLIVMATSNRVGLERLFLGSVATEVLAHSTTPVLVCR
jgi:nucleotide-binding universal stress UspA family protein